MRYDVLLEAAPPSRVDVTVTASSDLIARVTRVPTDAGTVSVTFPGVTTTSAGTFYIQGRSLGSTILTARAPGYADTTSSVDVHSSGFVISTPRAINTNAQATDTPLQIRAARLDPTTLNRAASQSLAGGLMVSVEVTSSDTGVGGITVSPVVFSGGDAFVTTRFDPVAAGTTTLEVLTPIGFDVPSNRRSITATVTP